MEGLQSEQHEEKRQERPRLLVILCSLTFLGSGLNIISNLMIALFYDQFVVIAESISKSFDLPGMDMILEGRSLFFTLSALTYSGSFTGAVFMWKLKRTGFHLYTISQIFLVLLPMYMFHLPVPSFLDIIFTGLFIILYSTNLRYMS